MAKDENKERKSRKKRRRCVGFTTYPSSPNPHFHIIGHLLRSMTPLRAWYYVFIRIEVKNWLSGSYPESLTKWSNSQGSKTIWGSYNLLGTGDWLFNSCALQVGLDILVAQYTRSSRGPVNTAVCLARPLWSVRNRALTDSPRLISQPDAGRWAFTFVQAR